MNQYDPRQAIDTVLRERPELDRDYVTGQIFKLARETVYDLRHWAKICAEQANAIQPMPWEAGYLEGSYISPLGRLKVEDLAPPPPV